jgi:glycosyltransferase involved in cell wall biosynthesis
MTIAINQRNLRSSVVSGDTAASRPALLGGGVVAESVGAVAVNRNPDQPPGLSPRAVLRRIVVAMLRPVCLALRPVVRPLAWRARGFLLRELTPQLHDIRLAQASLDNGLQRLADAVGATVPPEPLRAPAPRLRRKVHQFHAGSATGDAITNSMLLIQRHLRAMGYDSDIFVEHVGPGLEGHLQGIAALPRHDDHVLLVHHSLGHAGFDLVAGSIAPKILIYHNITPPDLLTHSAHLQRAAELGRRQVVLWRDRVVAAVADSVFNGVELRRLGFPCVLEAALLFDTDALLSAANAHASGRMGGPFTVLFVGRMVPSKGQLDLVRGFAAFAEAWSASSGRAARLVLAGGQSDRSNPYRDEIEALIRAHRLQGDVLITGKLSDADLHQWFGAADLYVSMSRHEGFGVPLVEAMAHGVPVIALRAGAVAETLGPGAPVLDDANPEQLAAAMLRLALDPRRAGEMAQRQVVSFGRWALSRHLPVLRQALGLAGAMPGAVEGTRDAVIAGLRVDLIGPADCAEAEAGRLLWRGLELLRPGQNRWHETGLDIARGWRLHAGTRVVLAMQHDLDVDVEAADCRLAMVGLSGQAIGAAAVQRLNAGFDGVLVTTPDVARGLVDAGVKLPIRSVGVASGGEDWVTALRGTAVLSARDWAAAVSAAAADILMTPPLAGLRLAWVSPWNVRCGIAEYSRQLLTAMPSEDPTLPMRPVVLCDRRPHDATGPIMAGLQVQKCFDCGDVDAASDLARAIAIEDPDVVMIQHQPGILPWVALADLLERPALAHRCVVVTLHNTGDIAELPAGLRGRLGAVLGGVSRVLVHAQADIAVLADIGVRNVAWLPHGCDPVSGAVVGGAKLDPVGPVIGTTGFILPHKGFRQLLRAAALLRREWPGLRVRMVTARHTDPGSDCEYAACQALIGELEMAGHVDWHTGFEPGERVLALLQPCDVLVMPYAPSHESASGAVRRALSSGVATLVSDLPLFDDLGDAVGRLADTTPEAIASAVAGLLRAPVERDRLREQARQWLAAHDWETIGIRLQGGLVGLYREHRARQMELTRRDIGG